MQHVTHFRIAKNLLLHCKQICYNLLISFLQGYLGACGALLKLMKSMDADKDLGNFGTINGS